MQTSKVRPEARAELKNVFMFRLLPILSSFPFVRIHPCVNLYAIFRLKQVHVSYLEIGKLMKVCLIDMLEDTETISIAMIYGRNVPKPNKVLESVFFITSMLS